MAEKPQSPGNQSAETTEATDSAPSRPAGSAASPFIGDPGPQFDAGQADELGGGPPPARPRLEALPGGAGVVEEDTVRGMLTAQGELVHLAAGVGEEDWRYTAADLAAIAPPLTRICNRYPAAAETVSALGDPAAAGIGLFNYGLRSLQERRAVLDAQEEEPDVPVTGVHAPPGTGPTPPRPTPPPARGSDDDSEVAGGGPNPEEFRWQT